MIPIQVSLLDGSSIIIFTNKDVEAFCNTLLTASASAITDMRSLNEYLKVGDIIVDCTITLADGIQFQCSMYESDLAEAATISSQIMFAERTYNTEYLRMNTVEEILDRRLLQVRNVINNLPNKTRRLKLHDQYLKRKTAYITGLEALVEGAFRD